MGQYYKIVNLDKSEYLKPRYFDCGAKLMEWGYCYSEINMAFMNLLSERWKGDRVFVVGDYAEADDPGEAFYETLKEIESEIGVDDLYGYARENMANISGECDITEHEWRYIYNHKTKQMIDMQDEPIEWVFYDPEKDKSYVNKVSALALLLAMGNGRGGGDYWPENNNELVGSWCSTSNAIEVRKEPLPDVSYERFSPGFTENRDVISGNRASELQKKAKDEWIIKNGRKANE